MAEIKTQPTEADVTAFLDAVPDERRRAEGFAMLELMTRITGAEPVMWGPTMVGFGTMTYKGKTSEGEWFIVGFSPRKAALTVYGAHNDYGPPEPLLAELGPHTTGVSCLYIKRLDAVDLSVLERLLQKNWDRYSASDR
jgi:hypothetical protein